MKTITIDDKEIEISDESYEALKKQFVTKDKAILWKPEDNKRYWTVDGLGDATWYYEMHQYLFEMGNVFRTEEEAQEALETGWIAKRKAEVKILRFIAENDLEFEPDWEDDNQKKWHLFYDGKCGDIDSDYSDDWQYSNLPHFKTESDAQKVIDAMTPELKILFGVK